MDHHTNDVSVKPDVFHQLMSCFMVLLGPILFGFTIGFSSPAIPELEKSRQYGGMDLTVEQASWFSSLVTLGALLGGILGGFVADKAGRKLGIMLTTIPYAIGWFMLVYAKYLALIYIGRILTGVGTGMVSVIVPIYIAELSSKHLRGITGGGFQLSITIGILIIYIFGLGLSYVWLSIISLPVTAALIICMAFLPESPTWLLRHGRRSEAVQVLFWLRGKQSVVEKECREIEENLMFQGTSVKIIDVFKNKSLYRPLLLVLLVMVFQQLSGINAVMFNTNTIFYTAGFKSSPEIPSVIIAAVQVVMTFVSCLIMDKAGRKLLLIISGTFMCVSCITFSLYYIFEEKHILDPSKWYMKAISLGSLTLYISMFSIGWGPVPWLYMSEILPSKVRGLGSALGIVTNWGVAFLVTRFFSSLQSALTHYGVFFLFAGTNFLGVILVSIFLIETKGRSLEEIEGQMYGHNRDYTLLNDEEDNDHH